MFESTGQRAGAPAHDEVVRAVAARACGGAARTGGGAAQAGGGAAWPDPAEFMALARFAQRQVARYDAVQLRALGMIARSRPPDPGDRSGLPFSRAAAVALAAGLDVPVGEAIARMQLAWTLTGRLHGVLEALEAGQINLEQAKAVARWSPPRPPQRA